MIPFSSGNRQCESFREELRRLNALVDDMGAIGHGAMPEDLVVEEPPLLDRWMRAVIFAPCLVGLSTGHPLLPGQGRFIHTSELRLIDEEHGWARTSSRWYRLGRPGGQAGFDA